jgi:hypothetical protein
MQPCEHSLASETRVAWGVVAEVSTSGPACSGRRRSGSIQTKAKDQPCSALFSVRRVMEYFCFLNIMRPLDTKPFVNAARAMARGRFLAGLVAYLEFVLGIIAIEQKQRPESLQILVGLALMAAQIVLLFRLRKEYVSGRLTQWLLAFSAVTMGWMALISLSGAFSFDIAAHLFPSLILAPVAGVAITSLWWVTALRSRCRSASDLRVFDACVLGLRPQQLEFRLALFSRQRLGQALPWFALALLALGAAVASGALSNEGRINRFFRVLVTPSAAVAALAFLRGRRHIKLRASELRARDPRAPVLLLRAFQDDSLALGRRFLGRRVTLEQVVAKETQFVGPCIAIGEPGEKLPPLGASREYLEHSDWKAVVQTLIGEAALILFYLGSGASLEWEFQTVMAAGARNRLLALTPPLRGTDAMCARWRGFAQANTTWLGAHFPLDPPADPVIALFFTEEGPVLINGRPHQSWDYRCAIRLYVSLQREGIAALDQPRTMIRS